MKFADIKDGKIDAQSNVQSFIIYFSDDKDELTWTIEVSKEDLKSIGKLIEAYFPTK